MSRLCFVRHLIGSQQESAGHFYIISGGYLDNVVIEIEGQ